MRKYINKIAVSGLIILNLFIAGNARAQTAGTFTFTINPVSHNGSYGAKHVIAMWIENSTGTFVKTKMRRSSSSTIDHLATWTSKSGSNIVDATTGATLTTYAPLTYSWDGTNVSKVVVADGDYKLWVEMAWDNSKTTDKTVTSFTFTKGAAEVHLTPANTSFFTSIALDWVPGSTGVDNQSQSKNINLFPNPSSGLVNVDFKAPVSDCQIQIANSVGDIISEVKLAKGFSGLKTIDLSSQANGIYLINILQADKSEHLNYKVILKK